MHLLTQQPKPEPVSSAPGATTASSGATPRNPKLQAASSRDYIGEGAAVVQAIAAIISIWFAARAVALSLLASREHRAANEVAHRREYFNRFMLEPATAATNSFRERSIALIDTAVRDLSNMGSASLSVTLEGRARAAIEQFNGVFYDLKAELRFADDALGNTTLWADLERRLQDLEDAVVRSIEQMALPAHRDGDAVVELVRAGTAQILAEIRKYDLTMHAMPAIAEPKKGMIHRSRNWIAETIAPKR